MTDSARNGNGVDLRKAKRRKPAEALNTDRLPPHSEDMERGVLGCILLAPRECLGQCVIRFSDVSHEVFYDLRHQTIYRQMVAMNDKQQTIDILSLHQRLKDCELLDGIGGIGYLNAIQDAVPSAANLGYYLDVVWEKWQLRKAIHVCTEVIGQVYEGGESNTLLDQAERDILKIRSGQHTGSMSIKHLTVEAQHRIEVMFQAKGRISGLSTGLADLDRVTDGLHPGEMVVVAAFPSTGKTALALNIAMHNAELGLPAGVLSLEMQPTALAVRAICSRSRVNLFDVRDGHCGDDDFQRMSDAAVRIAKSPVYIENANGFTIGQIKAVLRRMKQQHDIRMAVIDYLQLISNPAETREQEVSGISKGIKSAAMELNIPVLVLSQLNDDGKLRESRAIGQDADSIWKLANDGERVARNQPVTLSVEKNREGPPGTVSLIFQKQFTRFENAAKVSAEDVQEDTQQQQLV